MKILIATDGSAFSDEAVKAAEQQIWPAQSEFRVISVNEYSQIPYIPTDIYALPLEQLLKSTQQTVEGIAATAAARLRGRGLQVSYTVGRGSPAQEIVREAKEWGADLILMGTHGHTGLSKLLIGSVAQKVLADAHCSVGIMKRPAAQTATAA